MGWGSIFWQTRDIGLPSYSNNLSTDKMLNLRAEVEDGGYKRMLQMVAHMEMFLKYIKPVLFLLFFAGPKLFHKRALHVLLHISLKSLKCSSMLLSSYMYKKIYYHFYHMLS